MPPGRPSIRSEAIENAILDGLANGIPLTTICRKKGMPGTSTVFRWEAEDETFRDNITRAREKSADFYSHQIIEIADEKPTHEVPDPDGGVSVRIDPAGIQRNKLRIETRIKMMQMLKRKTYGDKSTVALTGEDGGPVKFILERIGGEPTKPE